MFKISETIVSSQEQLAKEIAEDLTRLQKLLSESISKSSKDIGLEPTWILNELPENLYGSINAGFEVLTCMLSSEDETVKYQDQSLDYRLKARIIPVGDRLNITITPTYDDDISRIDLSNYRRGNDIRLKDINSDNLSSIITDIFFRLFNDLETNKPNIIEVARQGTSKYKNALAELGN